MSRVPSPNQSHKISRPTVQGLGLIFAFILGTTFFVSTAFGFDFGEVAPKPGYSLTLIPDIGAFKIQSSSLLSSAGLVSELHYGGRVRVGSRNAQMEGKYLEFSLQSTNFAAPQNSRLLPGNQRTLGITFESWSDSRQAWMFGYSLAALQESFISSVTRGSVTLEKGWVYRGRLHFSVALFSPSFGPRAQYDNNVSAKDSPKVRLQFYGGPLAPYRSPFLSTKWGYEAAGKVSYGNSISWVAISYDRQEQVSINQDQRRSALLFELAIGLDVPMEVRQKGAAW